MTRVVYLVAAILAFAHTSAMADTRFVTWNIANFWHKPGEYLRPERGGEPGLIRISSDYDAIRAVIGQLGGDVFALQEMGSPESVRALFPEADWGMVFTKNFAEDLVKDPDMLSDPRMRNIYPAIVYRKSTVKVLEEARIDGLRLPDAGDDGVVRYTREGLAAKISVGKRELWVANVHLKSGCSSEENPFDLRRSANARLEQACKMLAAQIPVLNEWLRARLAEGSDVVLLGDFNHQLGRANNIAREKLDAKITGGLSYAPSAEKSLCTAFRDDEQPSIDFVFVTPGLKRGARLRNPTPKLNVLSEKISDHCPVWLDIDLSKTD
jgi:endonuclease/exonuclease/phosphatase family metal-dependent hydrolase